MRTPLRGSGGQPDGAIVAWRPGAATAPRLTTRPSPATLSHRRSSIGRDPLATPVVLIPGDGIGPEVTRAMQTVVGAAGAEVTWVEAHAGLPAVERFGDPLPPATLDLIRRYRVALKGPCTTPVGKGVRSINVRRRQDLALHASVRAA